MKVEEHNREAWNKLVSAGNEWTIPVSPEIIAAARRGEWEVLLTESKPVPKDWFPDLNDCELLCLASGGGQQGPTLAAAGARVTVFDNSPKQLEKDRLVADREGLELTTIQGDMQDLSVFGDQSFDFIFHPVSNIFIPDVEQVWREAYRVLKFEGTLLAGMLNPIEYTVDRQLEEQGVYQMKHALPYSDLTSITAEERIQLYGEDEPIEFSHTLETLIGGQTAAGFVIVDFYESYRRDDPIAAYIPSYFATRALKTGKLSA
jgi:ubiquinone/menaquinone biosynthesis C-methylase UbiE